jgi:hypothetical protein
VCLCRAELAKFVVSAVLNLARIGLAGVQQSSEKRVLPRIAGGRFADPQCMESFALLKSAARVPCLYASDFTQIQLNCGACHGRVEALRAINLQGLLRCFVVLLTSTSFCLFVLSIQGFLFFCRCEAYHVLFHVLQQFTRHGERQAHSSGCHELDVYALPQGGTPRPTSLRLHTLSRLNVNMQDQSGRGKTLARDRYS